MQIGEGVLSLTLPVWLRVAGWIAKATARRRYSAAAGKHGNRPDPAHRRVFYGLALAPDNQSLSTVTPAALEPSRAAGGNPVCGGHNGRELAGDV